MINAVIFDFDGVLVESVDIKTKAFAKLFESEGDSIVQQVVEYHLNNTGVSRFVKFEYIYKQLLKRELTDEVLNRLCARFSQIVIDDVVNAPYVSGALEFLKGHLSEYVYFVVSATPQKEMENIATRRNIRNFFKRIYGSPTSKNDAVRMLLSEENLISSNVLYVGDALSDYEAASANGVKFVARINNNESLFLGNNCLKVKDFTDIDKLIKGL